MKITLNNVTNIDALSVINDNFDKIEQELQNKVLYRNNPVGEPNSISNDIDMNGSDLLNVGDVVSVNGRWATIDEVEDIKDQVEASAATVAADKAIVLGYRNTAQTAATDAQTAYDNFDDRYLGSKSADPSVDNDGNLLLIGALYYRTSGTPIMRVYNGTTWQDVGSITTTTTNLIDPTLYSSQVEAEAGVNNTKVITPLRAKEAIDKQVKEGFTTTGPIVLPGDASTALQAVPKQQAESISLASTELYRGTDTRIAELPETSLYDNNYSSMMVKLEDGRLVGWGRTAAWHLGTGNGENTDSRPCFAQFAPRIPDGVTIAGFRIGSADSFVWLSNGWVYHAGANVRGIGGHGGAGVRQMFTRINFFFANGFSVVDVQPSAAREDDQYSNALFLCSNGKVYFSGYADGGIAGDGLTAVRNIFTPVECIGITDAVGISASHDVLQCRFAWKADGTCYAWGNDYQGMLGLGGPPTNHTPAIIPGILVDKVVSRMSVNSSNARWGMTLFLLKDGTVRSAGTNSNGQLGDNTTASKFVPTVVSGLTNVIDVGIGGGEFAYCWAVTAAKELYVWGYNGQSALGQGNTVNQLVPVKPVGWIDEADTITTTGDAPFQGKVKKVITAKTVAAGVGAQQIIVLDDDGNVWSCGRNLTNTIGWNTGVDTQRFKRAALGAVAPGDKIVDIHGQGHANNGAGHRLFALTEKGRLLGSGQNNFSLMTAMPNTSVYTYTPIFLQPIRLGV